MIYLPNSRKSFHIPANLPGLKWWLDASQESFSDAAAVGTWTDRSSSGNDATQATSGRQPEFKKDVMNGRSAIRFSTTGDWLDATSKVAALDGSCTVFIVAAQDDAAPWLGNILTNSYGAGAEYMRIAPFTPNSYLTVEVTGAAGTAQTAPDLSDGVARIYTVHKLATNEVTHLSVNAGTPATNSNTATLTLTDITTIGAIKYNGTYIQPFGGDIAEIIIYDRTLSDSERAIIQTYLSKKYTITIT